MRSIPDWETELHPSAETIAALIAAHLPAGGTLVDAGTNTGLVAALVNQRVPACFIHGFEPVPEYAAYAQQRFRTCPNVTVLPVGLSDQQRTVTLYRHGTNLGFNTVDADYPDMTPQPALLLPLDWFNLAPHVLKVDVENHEVAVLHGAARTITLHHPVIIAEWSAGRCPDQWSDKVVALEWLFAIGYQRVDYAIALERTVDLVLQYGGGA